MLIDKPYYDYDYEPVPSKSHPLDMTLWSDKKVASIFAFISDGDDNETEIEKAERLQREANNNIKRNSDG